MSNALTVGYFHDVGGILAEAIELPSGKYMDSYGQLHAVLPDFMPHGTVESVEKFFTY